MAATGNDRREARDVLAMLATARRVGYEGEPLTPVDLGIDDVDDALEALAIFRQAVMQAEAAKAVREAAAVQLAKLLGKGGAARFGDQIVRYQKGWSERCIDPDGFAQAATAMIRQDPPTLEFGKLVNPNSVRKTGMPPAMRDTFYEKRDDDEAKLQIVPRDRAPKFLLPLEEGAVWIGDTDAV